MPNPRLSRRQVLQAAALGTVATGIAACAPGASSTSSPATSAAPGGTQQPSSLPVVDVEFWGVSSGKFADAMAAHKDEWRETKGVNLEYVRAPNGWGDQLQRVNTAVASGSVPDLIHLKDFDMWDLAARGGILGLGDFTAANPIDAAQFRGTVWSSAHYDGTQFAVPWKGSFVWVLFANEDLFTAAGLDPKGDVPTTWTEMLDVSKKLTDTANGQYGYTFYELGTREINVALFAALVAQAGGRILTDAGELTLNTPEATAAMQYMYDMLWTQQSAIPPDQMESRWDLVYAGKVGMWQIGSWFIPDSATNAPQLKYGLYAAPCNTNCSNLDTPETTLIPAGAKAPDASYRAIRDVLLDPALELELSLLDGFLPAFNDNVDKQPEAAADHQELWKAYNEIGKSAELAARQWTEGYAELVEVVGPELQAVWFNQKSVADGLAAAQEAGAAALERAKG